MKTILLIAVLGICLQACSVPDDTLIHDCVPGENMTVICGMQSPEDIALVPGGDYLLLSEIGNIGQKPGRLLLFDVNTEKWWPAYPNDSHTAPDKVEGDSRCKTPPTQAMSPHGTHMVQLEDKRWRYLVVNHGDREAVELFDVEFDDEGLPGLQWRGCVFPAEDTLMNDVVGLSNGDLVYTRMYNPNSLLNQLGAMLFKAENGEAWRWTRDYGVQLLPGTSGSMPNGLEISADERFVFINQYLSEEIVKYDLQTEQLVGIAPVASADNSAWGPDGNLWLATHNFDVAVYRACSRDSTVTCGMAFDIIALDPDSMETRSLFRHQGAPMGAATVAYPHRDKVYLGSFVGDRLAIVPLSEFQPAQ